MSEALIRRTASVADKVALLFAVAAIGFGLMFADALLRRVLGWHYNFVSIAEYLRVSPPYPRGLEWDHSFLWLYAAIGCGAVAGGLSDFVTWANKTPEQRRREHDATLELVEKQSQEKRERAGARKASRKPLSGWVRLWIVASVLLGILTYLIAHDIYSHASAIIPYNGDSDQFWRHAMSNRDLGDCIWSTAKADYWMASKYYVTCNNADPWLFAGLWAFAPGLGLAAVGLVCRWVYRGFRPKPPPSMEA